MRVHRNIELGLETDDGGSNEIRTTFIPGDSDIFEIEMTFLTLTTQWLAQWKRSELIL